MTTFTEKYSMKDNTLNSIFCWEEMKTFKKKYHKTKINNF